MYSSFNWDFWELENSGMISFRDAADPGMRAHKKIDKEPTKLIETFKKYLSHTIEEVQPDRVFIDSMETMFLVIKSHYTLMMCVDDLFDVLRTHDITSVITVGTMFGIDEVVEYGADSVTNLGMVRVGNNLQRSIHVVKIRGSASVNQVRVLQISDNGVSVLTQSPYLEF
uniref:KaiC-like domain-containing protein n=1 Tax=Candidatus Methanogaster sp. ANME-2c ERB4 TaxID=2759911 RepID=A0A7G9Y877_9EURY|nr:hypothetical protein NOJIFECI_00002 [Methanosarcinales archaeon ANME-2c ERB4]QNO44057.1 hypothetical protein HOOKONJN_00001 [Methanosarcinales archaeon ANME-2c ERB4]QNO44211.1 hypothetical protein EAPJJHLA_00002 [Methanosarcinales archaeon ANME-2c ERB4]QNO44790.1 hypothetical protein HJJCBNBL_00002 [Methanosarcinales archaeon ANME-2c ERB4]